MPSYSLEEAISTIRDQYFALVPARLLRLPPPPTLASSAGQAHLARLLLDERRFPQPEDGYRRLFWRSMLRELESGLRDLEGEADDLVSMLGSRLGRYQAEDVGSGDR